MGQYESITEKDKKIIMQVWANIRMDLMAYGASLFNVIFTDYPLMANFFPFSGPGDEKFEGHAHIFMDEFDNWMKNLDRPQELKKLLVKNGVNHAKRNIDIEHYHRMAKCFSKAVALKMGKRRFGDEEEKVFEKLVNLAFREVNESADKERVRGGIKK